MRSYLIKSKKVGRQAIGEVLLNARLFAAQELSHQGKRCNGGLGPAKSRQKSMQSNHREEILTALTKETLNVAQHQRGDDMRGPANSVSASLVPRRGYFYLFVWTISLRIYCKYRS